MTAAWAAPIWSPRSMNNSIATGLLSILQGLFAWTIQRMQGCASARRPSAAAQPGNASCRHLRRAHRRRRRQGRGFQGRGLFPGRIDIARRPLPVAGSARLGGLRGKYGLCRQGQGPKTRQPRSRRSCRVCVSCHRLFGRRCPLIMVRKWRGSGAGAGRPHAPPFAGPIRPGSAAPTRTRVAFCDSIFPGASACTRSRKRCSGTQQNG